MKKSIYFIILVSILILTVTGCGGSNEAVDREVKAFLSNNDTRYNNDDGKLRIIFGEESGNEWGIVILKSLQESFLDTYEMGGDYRKVSGMDYKGHKIKGYQNKNNNSFDAVFEYKDLLLTVTDRNHNGISEDVLNKFIEFADKYEKSSKNYKR